MMHGHRFVVARVVNYNPVRLFSTSGDDLHSMKWERDRETEGCFTQRRFFRRLIANAVSKKRGSRRL